MEGFSPILILSSFLSVVQLILTMVPGVWYTRKGTMTKDMRRSLSTIAFNLLLPCVVFINIVSNVSASTIGSYWPYAMNTTVRWAAG
jgi:predicted permease